MDVKADIIAWLLKQQDWFQDLAERVIEQGGLTADDLQQVVALLKTPKGREKTAHRTFPGLASSEQGAGTLRLRRIEAVKGIENLAPRLPLDFGTGNLTVIYGHNGSGKSSYTRVLKRISGKPRAAQLKSNVFHPLPLSEVAISNGRRMALLLKLTGRLTVLRSMPSKASIFSTPMKLSTTSPKRVPQLIYRE